MLWVLIRRPQGGASNENPHVFVEIKEKRYLDSPLIWNYEPINGETIESCVSGLTGYKKTFE